MSATEKPLVYLILGASGSGRRQIVADLIQDGLSPDDRPAVMIADDEADDEADAKLPQLSRWAWTENTILAGVPENASHVFFILAGRRSQVDQVEAFKSWLAAHGLELARSICVINCRLAEQNPPLLAWYEACVHFADIVLLNKREGVENKWISGFLTYFNKLFYPCIFEMVKSGSVKNPALILEPQARRMTHVFDEEQDWIVTNADGEEVDENDEEIDEDEELQAKPEEDPYFVRRSEGGRRVKELPDISKFL